MALCPEHPKRDQNPKFTPLSETTSIPVCFIWESPPGSFSNDDGSEKRFCINLNQFEIVQLVGATESCYEDTKILQFHPGQAIHCRCKVSNNGPDTKSVLSTRGVAATCRLLYPTFQEISRAKSCSDSTEMCKISVLHVQSRQLVVVLLIKPLIIYWAFLLQSPDCSRCHC